MNRIYMILVLLCLSAKTMVGQKDIRTFIFGHSLIHHELQVYPTPSQETSVPHWVHFLAETSEHRYAVSGQYGFLPQHANLPPIAQWGFDFVRGAWDSDNEPFSAADFNSILITPGNFIQWQGPAENYHNEDISPLEATTTIINWCTEQEEGVRFYIYENWPDMAPYLSNGFPPSSTERNAYLNYLNGAFHDWFLAYQDSLTASFPGACVRMIPVGPIINNLLIQSPFDQIPITELYEDDAPHGRASIYFLASLATYMAMFEEKAPMDYEVDTHVHSIIRENYAQVIDYIWTELLNFNDEESNSRVFCETPLTTAVAETAEDVLEIQIYPNPVQEKLWISSNLNEWSLEIYDLQGKLIASRININSNALSFNVKEFLAGTYHLLIRNEASKIVRSENLIFLPR